MSDKPLRLLRLPAVLDRVGLSAPEIKRRIAAGTFPSAVPIGERTVGWAEAEIDAWILARIAERDAHIAEAA